MMQELVRHRPPPPPLHQSLALSHVDDSMASSTEQCMNRYMSLCLARALPCSLHAMLIIYQDPKALSSAKVGIGSPAHKRTHMGIKASN